MWEIADSVGIPKYPSGINGVYWCGGAPPRVYSKGKKGVLEKKKKKETGLPIQSEGRERPHAVREMKRFWEQVKNSGETGEANKEINKNERRRYHGGNKRNLEELDAGKKKLKALRRKLPSGARKRETDGQSTENGG